MKRLLVTGANGFVGARLAAALVAHPAVANWRIMLSDMALDNPPRDERVEPIEVTSRKRRCATG